MKRTLGALLPLAAAAVMPLALSAPAVASSGTTYQATLNPLNHATGSGTLSLTLNGNQATINEHWSGLASTFSGAPYPHVQHIHIDGQGMCPTPSADKNGDGVISTTEGAPAYGGIGTTLSVKGDTSAAAGTNIKIAPSGSSTDYSRTITLDSKTLASIKAGTAVIVVHGLDPTTLSKKAQKEKSDLVPALPLAATSPALCGALSAMPSGGPATGNGSTSGTQDAGLLALGGGLIAMAGGMAVYRRRTGVRTDKVQTGSHR
ncbi:MAG: hypothetical protein ACRDP1_16300 [Nocardioidaceae bacterium]